MMHIFKAFFVGASLMSMAAAQLMFTTSPSSATGVTAGVPFGITYSGDGGLPVTIKLLQGDPSNLQEVAVLTTTETSGSFTWTPSPSLPNANDYALSISQGTTINYSAQFPLAGGGASASMTPSMSPPATPIPTTSPSGYSMMSSMDAMSSSSTMPPSGMTSSVPPPMHNGTTSSPMSGGTGSPHPINSTINMPTMTSGGSGGSGGSVTGGPRGGGSSGGSGGGSAGGGSAGGSGGATPSMEMSTGGAGALASSMTSILGTFAFATMMFFFN